METMQLVKSLRKTWRQDRKRNGAENITPWNQLPYFVLVRIFRYLDEKSMCKMAAVCRTWREATQHPSLWRSHTFSLYSDKSIARALIWLKYHQETLRHAIILCSRCHHKDENFFFETLGKSNLNSLNVDGENSVIRIESSRVQRIAPQIINVLKTQKLVSFVVKDLMLSSETGLQILETLALSSRATIIHLRLSKCIIEPPASHEELVNCLRTFSSLSEIELNYQSMTDSLIEGLAENCQNIPLHLRLICWPSFLSTPQLSPKSWARFASTGRRVMVNFELRNIENFRQIIEEILFKEIPVFKLKLFVAKTIEENNHDLTELLQHIGLSYGQTLQSLMIWSVKNTNEEGLFSLLSHTPHLVSLDLLTHISANLLRHIFERLQNGGIQLQSLLVQCSFVNSENYNLFKREVQNGYQILKEKLREFLIRGTCSTDVSADTVACPKYFISTEMIKY